MLIWKKEKKTKYDYNIVSWLPVFPGFEGTELQINTDAVVEAHNRWLENPYRRINSFLTQWVTILIWLIQ